MHTIHSQLDPGPGATIGGMMSTGCSGRTFPLQSDRRSIIFLKANAVRYGTAKGEWFLNAVCSFIFISLLIGVWDCIYL